MKTGLFYAGITGFTGVLLGAFGAHALKETLLAKATTHIWETAVLYHLVHAVAALSLNLATQNQPGPATKWATRASAAWLIGTGLFSGSLYLLALGGPKWLGPITPLGGAFLLAGWACILMSAYKPTPAPSS